MKKLLLTWISALLLGVLAPTVSYADDCGSCCCTTTEGIYIQGFGGMTFWRDNFGVRSAAPGDVLETEHELGYYVGGAVGWRCCSGWRFEVELSYRTADIDTLFVHDGSSITSAGVVSSEWTMGTYLANFIYECSYEVCGCCYRPFFGVGFGVADINFELNNSMATINIDDGDTVFAYQLIMGIAYPFNDCLDLALEYRYLSTGEVEMSDGSNFYRSRDWAASHNIVFSAKWVFSGLFPL